MHRTSLERCVYPSSIDINFCTLINAGAGTFLKKLFPIFFSFRKLLLQVATQRNMEATTWQDLAALYTDLGLWPDARTCLHKAKLIEFHSPKGWHATGSIDLALDSRVS